MLRRLLLLVVGFDVATNTAAAALSFSHHHHQPALASLFGHQQQQQQPPQHASRRSTTKTTTTTTTRRKSRSRSPLLLSASYAENNDVVKSAAPTDTAAKAVITRLEKLRARQSAELQETDRVIELLTLSPSSVAAAATAAAADGSSSTTISRASLPATAAAAASVLYGFDYGFVSRSQGAKPRLVSGGVGVGDRGESLELFLDGTDTYEGPPGNILEIGFQQFFRNLDAMRGEYGDEKDVDAVRLSPKQLALREKLRTLTLNTTAIWERELKDGPIQAPWLIKVPYLAVCYLLDVVFEGRYVPSRFYLLETVARMPYFSYISLLHLYETLGFWRRSAQVKRVHFAEELNEYRHLLIMESLGGDQAWWCRFLAQHTAVLYYWILGLLWLISPSLSYQFSELLETHAVNTYGVFLDENEVVLKELPPSLAAVEYYCFGASDPFYSEFQIGALADGDEVRRPGDNLRTLYDVFAAIKADEGDHVEAMRVCLDPDANLKAPSLEKGALTGAGVLYLIASYLAEDGARFLIDFESLPSLSDVLDGFF